jgi:uncharacterized membrane protein
LVNLWERFLSSFDNHSQGMSGRKLSAFAAVIIGVWISNKFTNADNLQYILAIWLIYSLLCLGIITFQQVIELKNGQQAQQPTDTQTPQQ